MKIVVGVACFLAPLGMTSAQEAQSASRAPEKPCEVRVFKGGVLQSVSPTALHDGLIASFVEAERLGKFPTDTVEEQMELALSRSAMRDIVETVPWSKLLGAAQVDVKSEDEHLSKADIRKRVDAGSRSTHSSAPCYLELYASQQDFTGSFIKSHLYSHFTLIDFRTSRPDVERAIVWSRSRNFPARDEASLPAATEALRLTFEENLQKFLAKKFKK